MSAVLAGSRVLDSQAITPTSTRERAEIVKPVHPPTNFFITKTPDSKPAATLTADQVMPCRTILTQISLITPFLSALNYMLCLIASLTLKLRKSF